MVGHVVSSAGHQVALLTWDSLVAALVVNTCPSMLGLLGLGICTLCFPCSSAIWLPLLESWLEVRRWEACEISVVVAAADVG